ncbi:MAG: succinate dehydrogenase, hydrophobic membrane anchor protein [Rubrimonas sp.]
MSFKTPMGRVIGLGSAKDGVEHWWSQRLTSVALIPLTLLSVLPLGRSIGAGFDAVRATYSDPWNALVLILFIAATFRHLQQGLQVVIEDYVHDKPWRTGLLLANTGLCWLFGLMGVFGAAKIAFGA